MPFYNIKGKCRKTSERKPEVNRFALIALLCIAAFLGVALSNAFLFVPQDSPGKNLDSAAAAPAPEITPDFAQLATADTPTSTPSPTPTATATETPTSTPTSTPTAKPTLTPIAAVTPTAAATDFKKYFTRISLGKLPSGPRSEKWWENVISTAIIGETEDFCVILTAEKEVAGVYSAIYNANNKVYFQPKTPYSRNGTVNRNSVSCSTQKPGLGLYEFRVWIADELIASLPFEIKPDDQIEKPVERPKSTALPVRQPTTPPATAPAPTQIPQPSPGPLKIPPTGFAIPVSQMDQEAEVAPGIADKVKVIFAYRIQAEEPNMIVSMRIYNLLRENITGITEQTCLINASYSYCYDPTSSSFSAGNPVRSILLDANYSSNLTRGGNLIQKYGIDWQVKIKILSIVVSTFK